MQYFFECLSGFVWLIINSYIGLLAWILDMLRGAAAGAVASKTCRL
jgi:hypothetical protein